MKKNKTVAIIGECMIELSGQPFLPQQQRFGGDTLSGNYVRHKHQFQWHIDREVFQE